MSTLDFTNLRGLRVDGGPGSIRTIVELIANTTTTTGLSVQCAYDPTWYPTGERISDRSFATIPLRPHDWHGEWNSSIAAP